MFYAYGTNKQNSRDSFVDRTFYDTELVRISKDEPSFAANDIFIDMFINKPFYGRIDYLSDSVVSGIKRTQNSSAVINTSPISDRNYMKKFKDADNVYAMNFVVDAFEAMATYYNFSCQVLPKLLKDGPLGSLAPKVGWISPVEMYYSFMDSVFDYYKSTYLKEDQKKITNFQSFFDSFRNFLYKNSENFSILFSSTIMSRYVSPNISGLIVEIAIDDHSDDFIKTSDYLDNQNYEFFKECTQRYGFFIDRNTPWRLIANLSSGNMLPYMQRYNFNRLEEVFSNQFLKSHQFDLFFLRDVFYKMYTKVVALNPIVETSYIEGCDIRIEQKELENFTVEDFYKAYPLEKFLNIYVDLMGINIRSQVGKEKMREIRQKTKQIYLARGIEESVRFVNDTFNSYGNVLLKKQFFTKKYESVINAEVIPQPRKIDITG